MLYLISEILKMREKSSGIPQGVPWDPGWVPIGSHGPFGPIGPWGPLGLGDPWALGTLGPWAPLGPWGLGDCAPNAPNPKIFFSKGSAPGRDLKKRLFYFGVSFVFYVCLVIFSR